MEPLDAVSFTLVQKRSGHSKAISSLKFSPDTKWLATASADGTVCIWEARTLRLAHSLSAHVLGVNDVCWSPDSRFLASASDDATVILWDVLAGEALHTLRGHTNYVMCVAWSAQGNLLASGSYDESVRVWDARSGQMMRALPAHSDPVVAVDFARDGSVLVTGSYDGLVRLWDSHSGQCLTTLADEAQSVPVTAVRFTPNAQFIVVASLNNTLRLVRVLANKQWRTVRRFTGHRNQRFPLVPALLADDTHSWLVSGSEGDQDTPPAVVVWDVSTRAELARFGADAHVEGQAILAVDAAVAADVLEEKGGKSSVLVASADLKGTLCLWRNRQQ